MTPIKIVFQTEDGKLYTVYGQLSDVTHDNLTHVPHGTTELLDGTKPVVATEITLVLGMS